MQGPALTVTLFRLGADARLKRYAASRQARWKTGIHQMFVSWDDEKIAGTPRESELF